VVDFEQRRAILHKVLELKGAALVKEPHSGVRKAAKKA
jgi:hypothetical protein